MEFYELFTFLEVNSDILNTVCRFPSHMLHAIAEWWVDSYKSSDLNFIPGSAFLSNFIQVAQLFWVLSKMVYLDPKE